MTTVNGVVYTTTSFAGYAYIAQILSLANDMLADIGRQMVTTSSTPASVTTGTTVFTMAAEVPYIDGAYVQLTDQSAPTVNWVWGIVTGRTGTSLEVNISETQGAGLVSAWNIQATGPKGPTGSTELAGTATGNIDMSTFSFTGSKSKNSGNALGNLGSGSTAVSALSPDVQTATLTADHTLNVEAPSGTEVFNKFFHILNQNAYALTVLYNGATTQVFYIGGETDFTTQSSDAYSYVALTAIASAVEVRVDAATRS